MDSPWSSFENLHQEDVDGPVGSDTNRDWLGADAVRRELESLELSHDEELAAAARESEGLRREREELAEKLRAVDAELKRGIATVADNLGKMKEEALRANGALRKALRERETAEREAAELQRELRNQDKVIKNLVKEGEDDTVMILITIVAVLIGSAALIFLCTMKTKEEAANLKFRLDQVTAEKVEALNRVQELEQQRSQIAEKLDMMEAANEEIGQMVKERLEAGGPDSTLGEIVGEMVDEMALWLGSIV